MFRGIQASTLQLRLEKSWFPISENSGTARFIFWTTGFCLKTFLFTWIENAYWLTWAHLDAKKLWINFPDRFFSWKKGLKILLREHLFHAVWKVCRRSHGNRQNIFQPFPQMAIVPWAALGPFAVARGCISLVPEASNASLSQTAPREPDLRVFLPKFVSPNL